MKDFDADRAAVIKRAINKLVLKFIEVGDDLETSQKAVKLAQEWPTIIYAAVGVHPHKAVEVDTKLIGKMKELARQKGVVAIGEIGLDYATKKPPLLPMNIKEKNLQAAAFESQLHLARELNLPVIIHCRDAYEDVLKILTAFKKEAKEYNLRGVVHSFAGTVAIAQGFIDLGLIISFTANITYPNRPESVRQVIEQISLDKMLVETDAPFLPPQSLRGTRNEPSYVLETVAEIAIVKGISLDEVESRTTQTAQFLFGIE